MVDHLSTLTRCGFTQNEALVYLALLKLGSGTAVEITHASKVHRVNVYDVVERLIEKGMISTVTQGNKRIYEAAHPDQIANILDEKKVALQEIMPQLAAEYKFKKVKQQVHHFIGEQGVMRAYYMMLDQHEMVYGLGGSGFNRKYMKHRHEMWNKDRVKRKIPGRILYYNFTRNKKLFSTDKTVETRYLPDEYKTPCMVDICGDLVVNLLPVGDTIMAIVIENRPLADSYKQFFNFMWDRSKP